MAFETKDDALNALEQSRAEWLAQARATAWELGGRQDSVNVNDVRRAMPPLPDDIDPRVFGAIFVKSRWECLGYRATKRRTSHGRPIAQFRRL